ncbi:MAG: hypothetical protein ACREPX_09745 [Rhodanobacteraceae bacterium]
MQRSTSTLHQCTTRFVLCAIAAWVVIGCSRPPDEERIRAALASMQEAAEARRPAGVLDHISDDFTGNSGDVDRESLGQLLRLQLLRRDGVGVVYGPVEIVVDGERATVKFDVTLNDRSGRWVPIGGETYRIVSGWRREGGDWLCYNAVWTTS